MKALALALTLTTLPIATEAAVRRRPVSPPRPVVAISAAVLDQAVASALAGGVPGVSVAVARRGAVRVKGYGVTEPRGSVAVTPETIFQIASLTKQFTAAAIVALEEEGVLTVADPVTAWIPELDLGSRRVTLRQILTHTSGLRAGAELLIDPYAPLSQQEAIALVGSRGFASEPGTAYEYNNAAYWLLGVVIERASGMSYASYLEERFFRPLSLTRTAYCGTGPAVPVPAGSAQLLGPATKVDPIDMSVASAAGALCSTPFDLVRWTAALASGEAVSPSSYQAMITEGRLADGTPIGYGYGIGLGSIEGRFATSHAGTTVGFQSYLLHVPSEDLTVAVLVNTVSLTRSWASDLAREIARAFIE